MKTKKFSVTDGCEYEIGAYNDDFSDLSYIYYTINGKKEGCQREWWPGGKLKNQVSYVNGEKNSYEKHWDENETLITNHYYVKGKLQDIQEGYFHNGQKMYERFYNADKAVGIHKMWKENGEIENIVDYNKKK
jgi:antitoxin component YwqK of YwqJK toxin-antitoxin module